MPDDKQTLADHLAHEPNRPRVVEDCVHLVDEEVRAKSGARGVAIKGAYGTVKKIKPRFVTETIDGLLDDWIAKLEPYYEKWKGTGGSFADFVTARSDEVAEDLLSVTDERSANSKHKTAKKLYDKMRPSAKRNVVTAVPKLAKLVERYLDAEAGRSGEAEKTGS